MVSISVVIPLYNRAILACETLDSVLAQDTPPHEIIVVDDGSSDGGGHYLQSRYPEVTIITHRENRGLGAARNTGIMAASGQYVALLDSDDYMLPWSISTYSSIIEEYSCPSFIAGTARRLDSRCLSTPPADLEVEHYHDYFDYRSKNRRWWFAPSGAVIARESLVRLGGFWSHRDYFEDTDMWIRLGTEPGFVRIRSPETYCYRIHSGSMTATYGIEKKTRGFRRLVDQELAGIYPGGQDRQMERRSIIASHGRHHACELARAGKVDGSLSFFLSSFRFNLACGRFKFFLGYLPLLSAGVCRSFFFSGEADE